jgi:hypothetical protein
MDKLKLAPIAPRVPVSRLKRRLRALVERGHELLPSIEEATKRCHEVPGGPEPSSIERFVANWALNDEVPELIGRWLVSCERALRPAIQEEDLAQLSFRRVKKADQLTLGIEARSEALRGAVTGAIDSLEAVYEALPGRLTTTTTPGTLNVEPLYQSGLVNHVVLDEVLARMDRRTLLRQLPDCIGASKELCEAFAKAYLQSLHEPFDHDDNLPRLAGRVRRLLERHAQGTGDVPPETVKRILGNLGGIVQGVGELRNTVGTGHGRPTPPQGLTPAQANLAAECSIVFCLFLARTHIGVSRRGTGRAGPST